MGFEATFMLPAVMGHLPQPPRHIPHSRPYRGADGPNQAKHRTRSDNRSSYRLRTDSAMTTATRNVVVQIGRPSPAPTRLRLPAWAWDGASSRAPTPCSKPDRTCVHSCHPDLIHHGFSSRQSRRSTIGLHREPRRTRLEPPPAGPDSRLVRAHREFCRTEGAIPKRSAIL